MQEVKVIRVPSNVGPRKAALIETLARGEPGDELTYDELNAVLRKHAGNGDVRSTESGCLSGAINYVSANCGIDWSRWPRGSDRIRCLPDGEKPNKAERRARLARTHSRRSLTTLGNIDLNALDSVGRVRVRVQIAQMGTILAVTSGKAMKQLEAAGGASPPSFPQLLQALKNGHEESK